MKVLVTGGAGWIGRHVLHRLLSEGHSIRSFDFRDGFDVRLAGQVDDAVAQVDHVIHLAGMLGTHELFDAPQQAVEVNVVGSLNVLIACLAYDVPLVQIGMPDVNPSIYAATKVCAHRLAEAYRTHGLRYSQVIAYNAYGPGQAYGNGHPQKIIPTFAVAGWKGDPLPVWGDGSLYVDLVHVDDVAEVLVDAMQYQDGETLHAGTGRRLTVLEVADKVISWTGGRSKIEHLPARPGERPAPTLRDVAPAFSARCTFSWDRLRETVESYQ